MPAGAPPSTSQARAVDTSPAQAKSGTSGENSAAAKGRQAHKDYDPGAGYKKEMTLPSGKRADAVNVKKGLVKELKRDNPRAVRKGQKQAEAYRKELQKKHPQKK